MIVDGKAIAEDIYAEIESRVRSAGLRLGLVSAEESAVSRSFVNLKQRVAERLGVVVTRVPLGSSAETGDVINAIASLAPVADGIIVQLPLPKHAHDETVFLAMPSELDVDALNYTVLEKDRGVTPPVVAATLEVLRRANVDVRGKRVVVVGEGRLVGAPAAEVMKDMGARVSLLTRSKGSFNDLREADIIISGAGSPGLIKPNMIRDGVVLIDAGTSESGGSIAGDADPACAEKASVFTPVPGGVGPIAVAMIFRNLLELAKRRKSKK